MQSAKSGLLLCVSHNIPFLVNRSAASDGVWAGAPGSERVVCRWCVRWVGMTKRESSVLCPDEAHVPQQKVDGSRGHISR